MNWDYVEIKLVEVLSVSYVPSNRRFGYLFYIQTIKEDYYNSIRIRTDL